MSQLELEGEQGPTASGSVKLYVKQHSELNANMLT